MRKTCLRLAAPMVLMTLGIVGCSPRPIEQPAIMRDFNDTSKGFSGATNAKIADRIGTIAATYARQLKPGDRGEYYRIGARNSILMVPEVIDVTRANRAPEAARQLKQKHLDALKIQDRYSGETSLLYTLENTNIKCGPRDVVFISSDLLENVDVDIAAQLANGRVVLPAPPSKYLQNCIIRVVAAGMVTPEGKQLDTRSIRILVAAFDAYFRQAGATDIQIQASL